MSEDTEKSDMPDESQQAWSDESASNDEAIHSFVEARDAQEVDSSGAQSMQEELNEAKGQVLKLHAELENVRKRIRREADDQIRYASLPLMQDLLQVLDNLRRAVEAAGNSEDASGLVEGVQICAKQFEDTLEKFHCKAISAIGEPFDPNVHEAISQMPSDEFESGTVMIEATQGFQLHDRVVRPSQVIVSTGSGQ